MVTLTFRFNEERVHADGYTTDELLQPMREHAAKYGIDEISYGVFAKDGISALGAMERYIVYVSPSYLNYFDEWILDVNGETEDCVTELRNAREITGRYFGKVKHA